MKPLRNIVHLVLAAAFLAAGAAECAVPQGAVAVVNGRAIRRWDFERALVRTLGRATFDRFVDGVLVEQEAARKGIGVSEKELEARRKLELDLSMRRVFQNARMTAEEFRSLAAAYGWEEDAARREIEDSLSPWVLRIRLLSEKLLRAHVEITEPEVRRYYEWTRGERYGAAHVAVGDEAMARQLMEEIEQGELSWAAAVARHSLDRASVQYGGRMLPVPASCELGTVLARMQPGELKLYSDGELWHVLQLIRRIPPARASFEEVKNTLKEELYCRKVDETIDSWLAGLHARACIVPNISGDPEVRRVLGADVVAFVNGMAVPVSRFGEAVLDRFGARLIEPHIERELIFQEADRRGVEPTEERLRERLMSIGDRLFAERLAALGMDAEEFAGELSAAGISAHQYKDRLIQDFVARDDVRAILLAEQMVAGGVEVTEQDVRQAYQEHYGERLDVRRIIVEDAAKAEEIRNRALSGASFQLLVQTESVEPYAWMHKGLVTDIAAGHPYFEHVRDLREGELCNVFQRQGKYHLLKLVARRLPAEPPPFESVREAMRERAMREKTRRRVIAWLEKLKAEAQIEVHVQ